MRNTLFCFIACVVVLMVCPLMTFAETKTAGAEAGENPVQAESSKAQKPSLPADNVEWVKNATQRYSPSSWASLMKYEHLPVEMEGARTGGWMITMKKSLDTFGQLKGENNKTELLDRMALNIRVITLALQRHDVFNYARENKLMMDWDKAEAFFYVSPENSYYVSFPIKALFPSARIMEQIPESHRTFLFDTYIKAGSTTQRFGVVGLLEEFHAYYAGSKFYVDMLDAFRAAEGSDAMGFLEWVRHSQGTLSAFYEFDYFIREYLFYMKERHPGDYEALKSCRSFVDAYGAVRSAYESLIDQYLKMIKTEMQRLNETATAQAGFDNGVLWVRTANSANSSGTYVLTDREKLTALINGDRYLLVMADFPKR